MNNISFENLKGLSPDEVLKRQEQDGFNELPTQGKRNGLDILIGVLREPMFLLLIACGALYLLSGEFQEALMLLGFVFVIIGITFYQERKTERALEALKDLSSPRAYVIRDGEKTRIPGREVVRDDVILLSEGDRVPADCVLVHALNFSIDESLLTGESVPVRKVSTQDTSIVMEKPGGDDLPFAFLSLLPPNSVPPATRNGLSNTENGCFPMCSRMCPTGSGCSVSPSGCGSIFFLTGNYWQSCLSAPGTSSKGISNPVWLIRMLCPVPVSQCRPMETS
jgi:magnesium-transporting ATPase (P-type)